MQELLSRKCLYMQIDLPNYGFLDFLQLFLLGDTSRLIAGTPRQDKDVLKEYTKCKIFSHRGERSFVGEDPLKTTMLLQVARSWENRDYYFRKGQPVIGPRSYKNDIILQAVRRLPFATAIPLSLSIVLTVVTLVKVADLFNFIPFLSSKSS